MATDKLVDFDHVTDYISRALVMNAFSDVFDCDFPYISESTPRERIEAIPAADVRPVVRARWYWDNYRYDWCCSNCSHPADHYIDKDDVYKKPSFKFCPHCGADMREVKTDEK